MTATENVRWDKPQLNNFMAIPNIAEEELDACEFKLYAHYIKEAQWKKPVKKGRRAISGDARIGVNTVMPSRQSLQEKGYISITPSRVPDEPDEVTLKADIWERNRERYDSAEAQVDYAFNVLASAQSLTDEQWAILQEMVAARISATGGTNPFQAGTKTSQGRNESVPDSNIEESKEDSIGGEPAKDGAARPSQSAIPDKWRQVRQPAASREDEKPKPSATRPNILEHPMVKFFFKEYGLYKLSGELEKLFLEPISFRHEDGSTRKYGNLLNFWDTTPGFDEFAKQRIAEILTWKTPLKPEKALKHLQNVSKPGPTTDDPHAKPGFFAWRDLNPSLCGEIETEPEVPKVIEIYD